MRHTNNFDLSQIGNADQRPVSCDMPMAMSIVEKGVTCASQINRAQQTKLYGYALDYSRQDTSYLHKWFYKKKLCLKKNFHGV